jgi:hypothetical protein
VVQGGGAAGSVKDHDASNVRRTRHLRRTDVPHPDPHTTGEGIGGRGNWKADRTKEIRTTDDLLSLIAKF